MSVQLDVDISALNHFLCLFIGTEGVALLALCHKIEFAGLNPFAVRQQYQDLHGLPCGKTMVLIVDGRVLVVLQLSVQVPLVPLYAVLLNGL